MQVGPYQLQIFASLVVILAAAIVAVICDVLKRNNDQLRAMNIELTIRHEEEQKRSHPLTPRPAERVERAPKIEQIPVAPKERSALDSQEKKRTVNSEALAAMERGAALAGSGVRPHQTKPQPKSEVTPEVILVHRQEAAKPAISNSAAKNDWGALLSRNAHASKIDKVAVSAHAAETSLPAGFQDGFVLNNLVQNRQPVSGLVVSIGVNAARKSDGTFPESVHNLVQSLIGANDFAAQSGDDEFLLIYPEERGAPAQRRLSQIAQQLWDFQLRSLGTFQILFSWGGVEVRSESIEEAIASASERMQETKRGRKLLTMAAPAAAPEQQMRKAM